jgi:DNA-binding response OmpR family regulator
MVLEDDLTLLNLLQSLLGFEGYEVVVLEGFDQVVDDLRTHNPDGLILDIQLDEKNGLDLLDEIREDETLKQPYVLACSGLDYANEARQRGANDFIMKPYMPDDLVKLLKENIKQ